MGGGFAAQSRSEGLDCELTLVSFVRVLQNLKQQRSRREQFSQPPASSSPLMANNFSKCVGILASKQSFLQGSGVKHWQRRVDAACISRRVCSLCFSVKSLSADVCYSHKRPGVPQQNRLKQSAAQRRKEKETLVLSQDCGPNTPPHPSA